MSDIRCILCGNAAAAIWPPGGGVRGCTGYTPRHSSARINFTQHLMNSIIQFNIIHPICQTSGVFSVEMRLLPYDCPAAVSEDAQDIPQDIPVLGLILLNI